MTKLHFFTIADYEEEEAWLRKQHNCWTLTESLLLPKQLKKERTEFLNENSDI